MGAPSRRGILRTGAIGPRNPIPIARALQLILLAVITLSMLGATQSQFDRVGNRLMCSCGCGQLLLQCNHVGCPDSPVMIRELRSQIALGQSDHDIFAWFTAKYGPIILAAPIRAGFDRVAWIVPIAVFLLATAGTFVLVWVWKRRALAAAPSLPAPTTPPPDPSLLARIRQETEYR